MLIWTVQLFQLLTSTPSYASQNILSLAPPHDNIADPVSATTEIVLSAIKSFANGCAGGPDGLRSQHLEDLTDASALAIVGDQLLILASLTNFTNMFLNSKFHL